MISNSRGRGGFVSYEDMENIMKIKVLTPATAIVACGVCLLAAGVAAAQTAAPAAKPAPAASAQATPPSAKAKARPHHDGQAGDHFAPPHAPSFDELDTNHDGVVSKAEFDAWRAAHPRPDRPGPDGDDRRGGDGHGFHGGWGGGFEMRREMMWMHMHEMEKHHGRFGPPFDLEAADTDHDGKISWAEFQAAANARLKDHFDHLDANHDGFIEKDELPGHEGHHDRWHHEGKDDKAAANPAPATPAK